MKNRSTKLLIALLVIVVIMLIGIMIAGMTGANGGFHFSIGIGDKVSENISVNETYKLEDINSIEISSDYGDIDIKNSEDENVKVIIYSDDNETSSAKIEAGSLKIVSKIQNKHNWFSWNSNKNKIEILIPKNYSKEINIKSNYGDIDVANFENMVLKVDSDYGDLDIDSCKNLIVECSYGDIKANKIYNKLSIDTDYGDIDISDLNVLEDSNIKSDYGDIKIEKINDVYVDAKTDLGDVNVAESNRQSDITLKVENDCGDITIGK